MLWLDLKLGGYFLSLPDFKMEVQCSIVFKAKLQFRYSGTQSALLKQDTANFLAEE